MTVALVILGPLDRRSGGYSYDLDLVAALGDLGHRVELWSLPEGSPALAQGELRRRMAGSAPGLILFDALVHPRIDSILGRLRRRSGSPWAALVHHLAWLEDPAPGPTTGAKQRRERRFLDRMDALVFNSNDTRQSVATLRGAGAPFLPSVVCRPPAKGPVSPRRPATSGGNLLFLANLIPRKNLENLVLALGEVNRRRPDLAWSLTVAGSPEFDPGYAQGCRDLAIRSGIGHRVAWEGRVDDIRRDELWAWADLLTVPSSHEGWGMVYSEALVRGIPALAVRRGGAAEVLGPAGLWAPDGTPEALASALVLWLEGPETRRHLGTQATRRALALVSGKTGFGGLGDFLSDLEASRRPGAGSVPFSFPAYLEAKASVDDASLHPRVMAMAFAGPPPTRVLELGGGTGTMARRLRHQGLLGPQTTYTLVDRDPEVLALAHSRAGPEFSPGAFTTHGADLGEYLLEPPEGPPPDLVVAHALLDLFDPGATARALAGLGAKRYWLTHLFDGLTAWHPVVDPALDSQIEAAYHRTMDERWLQGGEGSATSGREWLAALPRAGFRILDAAASDWLVRPRDGRFTPEEETFLHALLHFHETSLTGRSDVDQGGLRWWLAVRRAQVARGQLSLTVHQIDLVAELVTG